MSKDKNDGRATAGSTDAHLNMEFSLDDETQKAIIDCIKRTGKVSLQLRPVGESELPGRGLLDGVEGKLID